MADQLCSTAGSLTSDREKHYEVRDIDTLSNGLSRPTRRNTVLAFLQFSACSEDAGNEQENVFRKVSQMHVEKCCRSGDPDKKRNGCHPQREADQFSGDWRRGLRIPGRARRGTASGTFAKHFFAAPAASARCFSLPYSRCRAFAVGKIPCSRASSAAAVHKGSGIGRRPVCDLRQRLSRRKTFRMLGGIARISLAIVCPPCPTGQNTDVSKFGQGKSCSLAESTLWITRRKRGLPQWRYWGGR